jgi:hypothetical protein
MDISLNGTLYVYFIRSVFEGNKKIGIEFIIDPKQSNNQLVDGLKRLNYLNGNKLVIYKDNYSNIDLISTKYVAEFEFTSICNIDSSNNVLKLSKMNIIEKDKILSPISKISTKVFLNNYSTGKSKTVRDIIQIMKST